jgi:hypothetical protein
MSGTGPNLLNFNFLKNSSNSYKKSIDNDGNATTHRVFVPFAGMEGNTTVSNDFFEKNIVEHLDTLIGAAKGYKLSGNNDTSDTKYIGAIDPNTMVIVLGDDSDCIGIDWDYENGFLFKKFEIK